MTKKRSTLDKQMTSAGPVTVTNAGGTVEVHQPHKVYDGKRLVIPRDVAHKVWKRDGKRCRFCGVVNRPLQIDYVCPPAKGGTKTLGNLVVACSACVIRKGDDTWRPGKLHRRKRKT